MSPPGPTCRSVTAVFVTSAARLVTSGLPFDSFCRAAMQPCAGSAKTYDPSSVGGHCVFVTNRPPTMDPPVLSAQPVAGCAPLCAYEWNGVTSGLETPPSVDVGVAYRLSQRLMSAVSNPACFAPPS